MPVTSADAPTAAGVIIVLVAVLVALLFIVRRLRRARASDAASVAEANSVTGAAEPTEPAAVPAAPPQTVLDYIDERTIALDVDDTDRDAVIRRLAGMMSATGRVLDRDAVVRAALERELISTTGIGEGVAIPHAASDAATSPVLAFARSRTGVDWNSIDEAPARLIFMIAVPEADVGTEHLRILAQLSRCLMTPSFRAAIEGAATPAEVLETLAASVRPMGPAPH